MSGKRVSIPPRPPADPAAETWIRQGVDRSNGSVTDEAPSQPPKSDIYTARLTVDVTPALRGRIKVAAFRGGLTVADMLRALLEREYPDEAGNA